MFLHSLRAFVSWENEIPSAQTMAGIRISLRSEVQVTITDKSKLSEHIMTQLTLTYVLFQATGYLAVMTRKLLNQEVVKTLNFTTDNKTKVSG
jgi:hypothetical protein